MLLTASSFFLLSFYITITITNHTLGSSITDFTYAETYHTLRSVMIILSLYFPILCSFFLFFLLPSIMNLFKKNIHSFLRFANTCKVHVQSHHRVSSIASVLGLITAAPDLKTLPDVVESATGTSTRRPSPTIKRDDIGGEVDGWMSCTESLGCESSSERRVDDQIEELKNSNMYKYDDSKDSGRVCRQSMRTAEGRGNWRKVNCEKKEVKSFPPPLSSLNRNGQPCFFLRPVRKDGRLELTEVRIHRPEILHASREDGRLRLHLIPDESGVELEEEIEEKIKEMIKYDEKEEEEIEVTSRYDEKQEKEMIRYDEKEEEKKKMNGEEWKFAMAGSEGFRRCHEMVNHHHGIHGKHHHLHMCGVGIV